MKTWILFILSNLRAEYNWRTSSRTLPSNLKLPLISEEIFNLLNLRVLPAKSKCKMPSDFWWKRQVAYHCQNDRVCWLDRIGWCPQGSLLHYLCETLEDSIPSLSSILYPLINSMSLKSWYKPYMHEIQPDLFTLQD